MGIWEKLGNLIAGREAKPAPRQEPGFAPIRAKRAFQGAVFDRLTADWAAQSTSQDSEVYTSMRPLRNRTRQQIRDNPFAKNMRLNIQNNVIGTGMRLQPKIKMQRGDGFNDVLNKQISDAWDAWSTSKNCDVAGKQSFVDYERNAIGAVVESGEIFVRFVYQKFGDSKVPFALEMIEADQCIDTKTSGNLPDGGICRLGIELDKWKRPTGYWFWPNHPGDMNFASNNLGREILVPASDVVHFFRIDRPGQTRGVSWFSSVIKRMHHMEGYEEAEIVAQRANSAVMGFLETAEAGDIAEDTVVDGQIVDGFEPGEIRKLDPGEKFSGFTPPRNAMGIEPFMRQQLRACTAGVGVSYESGSKDYSQGSYSNSRLGRMDDNDNFRVVQKWTIAEFHQKIFAAWLEMAVLAGVVTIPGFEAAPEATLSQIFWQARGWGFINPEVETNAYIRAVRAGIMTQEEVIESGAGGGHLDFGDKMERIAAERKLFKKLDIVLDTDPSQVDDKGASQKAFSTDAGQPPLAAPVAASGPDATPKPVQLDPAASGDAPGNAPTGTIAPAPQPQKG